MAEFRDQALGLTLRAALTIQSHTKAGDDAHKILDQIFLAVLNQIDNFDPAALYLQQLLEVVITELGQAVFVFHDDHSDGGIG